jgi:hypothetical protein
LPRGLLEKERVGALPPPLLWEPPPLDELPEPLPLSKERVGLELPEL